MKIFSIFFTALFFTFHANARPNVLATFPSDFFFGVANAPAQVEDDLDDSWLDWAKDGRIPAFYNYDEPEKRINFWTNPEREIIHAKRLGISVFRLGIDWGRLFPSEDTTTPAPEVLNNYRRILTLIKKHDMKVMLSLFHHAEPKWTVKYGSWTNKKMVDDFLRFSNTVVQNYGDLVDYWVTFNEANLYVLMTQVANNWPNKYLKRRSLRLFNRGPLKGDYDKSIKNVSIAHKKVFNLIKKNNPNTMVGLAHNVADYVGENFIEKFMARFSYNKFNYKLMDLVSGHMDYIGINYYGAEVLKGASIKLSPKYEYSDSGRAVSPNGFSKILHKFQDRYNHKKVGRKGSKKELPFIITENGVSDEKGWLRSSYTIEHLLALSDFMKSGAKVLGYVAWSLTDNLEWSDGYCPKFGLMKIDRKDNLRRIPRPGYFVFKKIVTFRNITLRDRRKAWERVKYSVGTLRPFCRDTNGETALHEPRYIKVKNIDWRYGSK